MDQKRIVFYTESPVSGGVSAVVEAIVLAATSSYNCTVVCQDGQTLRIWGEKLRMHNVAVAYTALRNKADILGWFELPALISIYRIFRQADLIHFHLHTTFSCLPAIFIAKLLAGKTVVITEHYIAQLRFIRNRRLSFPLTLLRELVLVTKLISKKLSLRCVSHVVTVSNANRQSFLSTLGGKYRDKVTSIPNGVDVERFSSVSAAHPPATESEPPIVTTIAGLNNQKGHEYLIRAIPQIRHYCPEARFVFAGEGHLRDSLEALAHTEGVAETITFAGQVEDVRPLLAGSTLVVLPSLFEGMPI
ncbi:MAG: glycosyltransferase, partial [Bacteroidota bacterium]